MRSIFKSPTKRFWKEESNRGTGANFRLFLTYTIWRNSIGILTPPAKCRAVRWISSFHSLLCWFECNQCNVPRGKLVLGSPQVAESTPAPSSICFHNISCTPSPVTETGFKPLCHCRSTKFSIILSKCNNLWGCSDIGPCTIAQQEHVWRALREDAHVRASHTRPLTLARDFTGQRCCKVLPSRGRNVTNHTFAPGVK